MPKGFKVAYRQSNKVDSTTQIITTYTRDHTIAIRDFTINAWSRDKEKGDRTRRVGKSIEAGKVH